eukprot:gene794-988_t
MDQNKKYVDTDKDEDESSKYDGVKLKVGQTMNITQDGRVTKQLIREGVGYNFPQDGDEVHAKTIDGTIFDNTRRRAGHHTFIMGSGDAIAGWELSLKTMLKGEIALLTIKPKYAYGSKGYGALVPPNTTVTYEMELLSFNSSNDISTNRDGSLLKTVIKEGSNDQKPDYESKTKISYIMKLEDGKILEEKKNYEFGFGEDQDMPPVLEKILSTMNTGEVCDVVVGYFHSNFPKFQIPVSAKVLYRVTLHSFEKVKSFYEYRVEEKLENGIKRKNQGAEFFKAKKLDLAVRKYDMAVQIFEYDYGLSDEDKKQCKELKLACLVNQGVCNLMMSKYYDVIKVCSKALSIDPNHIKALNCRGRAYCETFDFQLSLNDFQTVLKLDPSNADAKREIVNLKKKEELESKKEKSGFSKLINSDF